MWLLRPFWCKYLQDLCKVDRTRVIGFLCLVVVIVLWTFSSFLVQTVLNAREYPKPVAATSLSLPLNIVALLPWYAEHKRKSRTAVRMRSRWGVRTQFFPAVRTLLVEALRLAVPFSILLWLDQCLFNASLMLLTVPSSEVCATSSVLFVFALSCCFLKESNRRIRFFVVVCTFIGLSMVANEHPAEVCSVRRHGWNTVSEGRTSIHPENNISVRSLREDPFLDRFSLAEYNVGSNQDRRERTNIPGNSNANESEEEEKQDKNELACSGHFVDRDYPLGFMFGIMSAFCYAVTGVYLKKFAPNDLSETLLVGCSGIILMLFCPIALGVAHTTGLEGFQLPSPVAAVEMVVNALLVSVLGTIMWSKSTVLLSPTMVTIGTSLCLPLSLFLDSEVLKLHMFSWRYSIGCAVTFAGAMLISLIPEKSSSTGVHVQSSYDPYDFEFPVHLSEVEVEDAKMPSSRSSFPGLDVDDSMVIIESENGENSQSNNPPGETLLYPI